MTGPARLLIDAFSGLTRTIPADENTFGSPSLQLDGICDGTAGVQWSAWVEWHGPQQMAYASVNLEGMVYDGWPVARFIERERQQPKLLEVRSEVRDPARIEVIWYRDAWQVSARPPIREKRIGASPCLLHSLSGAAWTSMLEEAYECLDAAREHRGRTRQTLTMSTGSRRSFDVSPHFQLRQAFWPRDPATRSGWRAGLDQAMGNLRPLHRMVREQSRRASGARQTRRLTAAEARSSRTGP
jgi:hypothetical protein